MSCTLPASAGRSAVLPAHSPGRDHLQKRELLKQRFAEFGAEGVLFFDELLRTRRNGKDEAGRVLGLLAIYRREDLARALERAVRYRAFSWSAVERILAAQARPRSAMEALHDRSAGTTGRDAAADSRGPALHGRVSGAAGRNGKDDETMKAKTTKTRRSHCVTGA